VSAGITPPFSLLPAHAPDLNPLASFGPSKGSLVPRVFAGCYVPLLGVGPSRRYLHSLCVGGWTLTPRRFFGALARFFPKSLGLTLDLRGSPRSNNPQYTTLMGHTFRGCSHFFDVQAPTLASEAAPQTDEPWVAGSWAKLSVQAPFGQRTHWE
jgi:hypothetical protein